MRLSLNYYKAEQRIVQMIAEALSTEITLEISWKMRREILGLLKTVDTESSPELIDGAVLLDNWLDDYDIRNRDPVYNRTMTESLLKWQNAHKGEKS
jgi:hypothetical protein